MNSKLVLEMELEANKVEGIYTGKVARRYDHSMPPFFLRWKKKAFIESDLKKGDRVLVFCCGTGLDFSYILDKIGKEGSITAIDFSGEMLKQAKSRISRNNWNNIYLLQDDVTGFRDTTGKKYDAGVCTLGLSIIPDYKSAYKNLLTNVKAGGQIIIGDMQLASGKWSLFNPITIAMAGKFGGTHGGHKNSLKIQKMMNNDLLELKKKNYFLGAYYYSIGTRK